MGEKEGAELLLCYNRSCGQKFRAADNKEDSCIFHPGEPFFHDAYKGWNCCKKKCIDFTEFLNIKGCKQSFHNGVKPPEPQKPKVDKSKADEVIEYRAPEPITKECLQRPPFKTIMVRLIPTIAPSLKQQLEKSVSCQEETSVAADAVDGVAVGTSCKNNSCKKTYQDESSNEEECVFHPGSPVFHEGLKFWSCCQRRTTEFTVFLEQEGCQKGTHVWNCPKDSANSQVKCRYDWHQTASHVVVAIYAKVYDPDRSYVELNPIRLQAHLWFPKEDAAFHLDVELEGIVIVKQSSLSMMGTKVEVKLKKAEACSWRNLEVPHIQEKEDVSEMSAKLEKAKVDAVDLSDL